MRRLIKVTLLLFVMNHSLAWSVDDHKLMNPRKELYRYYFMITEGISLIIWFAYFVDHKKIEQAKIECSLCHYEITSQSFYAYLITYVKPALMRRLGRVITLGSAFQISQFLLNMHERYQIVCPCCQKYSGWQNLLKQSEKS